MAIDNSLNLHEELLLLALHDEKGTIAFGSLFSYAIAGAIITELMLEGRVVIEPVKRSKLLKLISSAQVGDAVLDECLETIRTARRRASVNRWVSRFARLRLRDRIAERLCMRGILRKEEGRVLLVFPRRIYRVVDPAPERDLVERMRLAIFENGDVDPRTAAALSLARAADLLRLVFGKKELKARKKRIEQLMSASDVARATKELVDAVRTAAIAAS